jgi:hypothetical protein
MKDHPEALPSELQPFFPCGSAAFIRKTVVERCSSLASTSCMIWAGKCYAFIHGVVVMDEGAVCYAELTSTLSHPPLLRILLMLASFPNAGSEFERTSHQSYLMIFPHLWQPLPHSSAVDSPSSSAQCHAVSSPHSCLHQVLLRVDRHDCSLYLNSTGPTLSRRFL